MLEDPLKTPPVGDSRPAPVNKASFFDGLKPKTAFWAGLISGVLGLCAIGFVILLIMFFTGDKANGNNLNNNLGNLVNLNSNTNSGQVQYGQPAAIAKDDHIRGSQQAKVVLIEYSDFQCPFCQQHHENLNKLLAEYGNKIEWVFRHFPLNQLHPYANKAALASECASEQGKFWEYGDIIFANQDKLSDAYLSQVASDLKLKVDQFNTCLTSAKYQTKVDNQMKDGQQAGVTGTPGTFINGQLVKGAVPYENLKAIVDNLLK